MKHPILCLLVLTASSLADITLLTVDRAAGLIEKERSAPQPSPGSLQILDVRTEKEWKKGRLEGCLRIDFYEEGFAEKVARELDPRKPVIVYCHSGGRSRSASELLQSLGFQAVYDLKGGIKAWQKAGKKVVK